MKRFALLVSLVVVAVLVLGTLALAGPPSWDDQINTPRRFMVLIEFGGQAVLDKETGLVWEKNPDPVQLDWAPASTSCYEKAVGNRKGSRPPSVEELATLIDPTRSNPALSIGHPLTNVQNALYWSSTTYPPSNFLKYGVNLSDGVVDGMTGGPRYIWCVRGGQGVDPVRY